MSTITVRLSGEREAVIREATAADVLLASEAAEKPIPTTDGGIVLVPSPTLAGFLTLVRQIESLGDVDTVTPEMIKKLSAKDLNALEQAADQLMNAPSGEATARRGRSDKDAGST